MVDIPEPYSQLLSSLRVKYICYLKPFYSAFLQQEVRSALVSNVNIELYNALHYHMANKRLQTKDLKNGLVVDSMYNDLGLYINHYSNGVSIPLNLHTIIFCIPNGTLLHMQCTNLTSVHGMYWKSDSFHAKR